MFTSVAVMVRRLAERLENHNTPKDSNWLNVVGLKLRSKVW